MQTIMAATTLQRGDVLGTDGQFHLITDGRVRAGRAGYEGDYSFELIDAGRAADLFRAGRRVFDADGQDGLEPGLWSRRRGLVH
jgi:hypothetical protein